VRSKHDYQGNRAPGASSKTISGKEDSKRLAPALRDSSDDQWVNEFIKRLNQVVEDIVRKK
jgi:hypothetical protein